MSVSRNCPVCGSFALAFEAAATHKDSDVIVVIGRCQQCKYKFRHDYDFEEMRSNQRGEEYDGRFHSSDSGGVAGIRKRESAEKQHSRWLGQDRQTPGQPYDPGRVSTPPIEGPPSDDD